jgi:hypothetical protein
MIERTVFQRGENALCDWPVNCKARPRLGYENGLQARETKFHGEWRAESSSRQDGKFEHITLSTCQHAKPPRWLSSVPVKRIEANTGN